MLARVVSFTLLLLAITVVPAFASNTYEIYNNGPINGQSDAWTINFGFITSNTFTVGFDSDVFGLSFGAWLEPGDVLTSAEVSITSMEAGGTTYFDETVNFTQSDCFTNSYGFDVCRETGNFNFILRAGSYWLNLQNATVPSGDPVYWDESDGPSLASNNSVGTLPSESFTIFAGETTSTTTTGTTPEPSSILLLVSGVVGAVGAVRRKLF